ncbi:MAG: hypothetical protein ACXWTY_01820 [Methylobacter sp.]
MSTIKLNRPQRITRKPSGQAQYVPVLFLCPDGLLNPLAAEGQQSHPWLHGTGIHASAAQSSSC